MLHLCEQDDITFLQVLRAPGIRHKIDALRGATCEDDLAGLGRIDKRCGTLSSPFKAFRRAMAQFVDATMHVRVVMLVVMDQRIHHLARFLAGCGVIEID